MKVTFGQSSVTARLHARRYSRPSRDCNVYPAGLSNCSTPSQRTCQALAGSTASSCQVPLYTYVCSHNGSTGRRKQASHTWRATVVVLSVKAAASSPLPVWLHDIGAESESVATRAVNTLISLAVSESAPVSPMRLFKLLCCVLYTTPSTSCMCCCICWICCESTGQGACSVLSHRRPAATCWSAMHTR